MTLSNFLLSNFWVQIMIFWKQWN